MSEAQHLSIDAMLDQYVQWARSYYRSGFSGEHTRTLDNILQAIKPLREAYGWMLAEHFKPMHLQALQQSMLDPDRPPADCPSWRNSTGGPLSPRTINDRIQWMRAAFIWAARMEVCGVSFMQATTLKAVKNIRVPRPRPKAVAWDDVTATMAVAPTKIAIMLEVQWRTGMRPDELCRMNLGEIITAEDPWLYVPREHKTAHLGADRVVYLGPACQELLRQWIGYRGMSWHERPGWLFPKRGASGPMQRNSYYTAVMRAQMNHGQRRWYPHQIRHAAGYRVRAQHGLEAAQVFLGHRDAQMTERYAPPDHEAAKTVARRIG